MIFKAHKTTQIVSMDCESYCCVVHMGLNIEIRGKKNKTSQDGSINRVSNPSQGGNRVSASSDGT